MSEEDKNKKLKDDAVKETAESTATPSSSQDRQLTTWSQMIPCTKSFIGIIPAQVIEAPVIESDEEATEYRQKLERIEAASLPKGIGRPRTRRASAQTQTNEGIAASTSTEDMEPRDAVGNTVANALHTNTLLSSNTGIVYMLKAPTQLGLGYHADSAGNTSFGIKKTQEEGIQARQDEIKAAALVQPNVFAEPELEQKSEVKSSKPHVEVAVEQPEVKRAESMQTLTIVGHSHLTFFHDHCHRKRTDEGLDRRARRKLVIASILCFSFMIMEIVGGVWSNSLAIATDAAHLLTDLAGFLISLFAIYLAARPASQRMNFGWYRAEVIGAMISVYFIWVITGILVWLAIERLITGVHEVDAKIMLITSALAFLVNLIMAIQLGHGHSHSYARHEPIRSRQALVNTQGSMQAVPSVQVHEQSLLACSVSAQYAHGHAHEENINVRAATIHVIGDMIQSVGVFLAALLIFFKPGWAFVDSICTFFFSIIVLFVTLQILRDVLMVLMEATPDYMDYEQVQATFLRIEGVEHVHNLRIWAISVNKVALSAHLAIAKDADPQKILEEATKLIHKHYKFFETTIQIEEYTPGMKQCEQCETLQRHSRKSLHDSPLAEARPMSSS